MEINWYKNDSEVKKDERIKFCVRDNNNYSLLIEDCDLSDTGDYKAVVKNVYGQEETKCRLNITANAELSKNSPDFIELLKDICVHEGEDACFKCRVIGVPQPDVKWFKDGAQVEQTDRIKVGLLRALSFLF